MASFFKQAYIPYACVIVGVVLIFLWARNQRREGFADSGAAAAAAAAPYKFHMYYVDWCPHCHSTKPEFEKLIAESKDPKSSIYGKVACEAIDAEKEKAKVLGKPEGYPTIQLYDAQGKMLDEYKGERNLAGFRSFLEDILNRPKL